LPFAEYLIMKIEKAVARLNGILPLKKHLDELDSKTSSIYMAILSSFYHQGKAPALLQLLDWDDDASAHIQKLQQLDMITLDETGNIEGCYPFTMQQRVHRIHLNGYEVHAMCALDALAPAAMFECHAVVDSECAVSGEAVHLELSNQQILNADDVAGLHFGINWMAANGCSSCSDSLCTEMLFLKDLQTAQLWLEEDPENREIFDLNEAVAFSAGFFKPLMAQN
jgi:alkylmercury lyase